MLSMRSFMVDLAKAGGKIARQHFTSLTAKDVQVKADRDYVSHADKLVEDTLIRRIRAHFPDHHILGEESGSADALLNSKALWIIDPIDGTTNFIHGISMWAISIAFCDEQGPHTAIVYDPMADELFLAERDTGLWLNNDRRTVSSCQQLRQALVATAMPFRSPAAHNDALQVFSSVQQQCDDQRRGGAASLDLAYVAVGRLDGYYELGIHPWDTAAGELLVRCGGGVATDYRGQITGLLQRRSIIAAAHPEVHQALLHSVQPLVHWLETPLFAPDVSAS
jgi:myo-inositol-1(or 4)-monophosphatase